MNVQKNQYLCRDFYSAYIMITLEQLKELQLRADKLNQYLAIVEKRIQLEEE